MLRPLLSAQLEKYNFFFFGGRKRRSNNELLTTEIELNAMAKPANSGLED